MQYSMIDAVARYGYSTRGSTRGMLYATVLQKFEADNQADNDRVKRTAGEELAVGYKYNPPFFAPPQNSPKTYSTAVSFRFLNDV